MAELVPRNFLQPCLLLLLRERSDHGYELVARLRPMHDGDGDAGGVYRALRSLERHGLVRSEWRSSDVGPSRRTYHLTSDGLAVLEAQVGGCSTSRTCCSCSCSATRGCSRPNDRPTSRR